MTPLGCLVLLSLCLIANGQSDFRFQNAAQNRRMAVPPVFSFGSKHRGSRGTRVMHSPAHGDAVWAGIQPSNRGYAQMAESATPTVATTTAATTTTVVSTATFVTTATAATSTLAAETSTTSPEYVTWDSCPEGEYVSAYDCKLDVANVASSMLAETMAGLTAHFARLPIRENLARNPDVNQIVNAICDHWE